MVRTDLRRSIEPILEGLLVLFLCVIPYFLFFTERRQSIWDHAAIVLLLIWRFALRAEPERTIPRHIVVIAALYAVSFGISAVLSENAYRYPPELNALRLILLAGLLFTAPISGKNRKIVIAVFFVAAAIAGSAGILQHFGIIFPKAYFARGFSPHHILYAGMLAFVCGSAAIMLFIHGNWPFRALRDRWFLMIVMLCTFGGVLFSVSRGVWIALVISVVITMFLYNVRKGIILSLALAVLLSGVFLSSSALRQRSASIVTSFSTEHERGSTWTRIELWKGSLLIFKESPAFGTGLWDYETDIERLIGEKKIKPTNVKMHAHNQFLHALATRGLTGLVLTVMLLGSLIRWGWMLAREPGGVGGHLIIMSTLIIVIGGLTEVTLDVTLYAFAYWFTIGMLGPYALTSRAAKENSPVRA